MPRVGQIQQYFLGVDPGGAGGLVLLNYVGQPVWAMAMPDTEPLLWNALSDSPIEERKNTRACIEQVGVMPGQGISSAFTFGQNFGALKLGLTAAGISHELVRPQVWMKALGIPSKNEKEKKNKTLFKKRLLSVAQRLVPRLPLWTEPRTLGKQLAIADALLIAEYCRRKHQGKL